MIESTPAMKDRIPGDSLHGLVRNFSQMAYLVVAPSPIPGGLPMIEDMKMTHGDADARAASLERAYSKESYPCGLIVVPCKIYFDIPNTSMSDPEQSTDASKVANPKDSLDAPVVLGMGSKTILPEGH